ncbi:hypothetical protein [Tautonia plasticadhaerens]|nr:hypothetical protein [Tautonia plasticadhaerens]
MLKTMLGVDEGDIYPRTYEAGNQYPLGETLLRCFVELGAVELVTELQPRTLAEGEKLQEDELPEGATAVPGDPIEIEQTKSLDFAPENKAIQRAPANKGKK